VLSLGGSHPDSPTSRQNKKATPQPEGRGVAVGEY
jgi:hypothetical protein